MTPGFIVLAKFGATDLLVHRGFLATALVIAVTHAIFCVDKMGFWSFTMLVFFFGALLVL